MTLRSYLRIFRERIKILVAVVVLGVLVGVLLTALSSKSYEASVQVFVTSNGDSTGVGQYDEQAAALSQVTTFAELIDTPKVIDAVQSDLHLGISDADLRSKLSATAPSQQTLVLIHATDGNADRAADIANSAAAAFITVVEDLKKPTGSQTSTVRLFATSRATAPSSPISPKPGLNITLGFILGLLLGVALAVARDVLDNRVKDVEDLAKLAGRPAMGVVVQDPQAAKFPIASRAGSRNSRAENFRQLRANLQFANVDHHPRIIAITSSVPAEGKTMVAMNLAATLAEAGFTVCLVDADLRRPSVAKTLGLTGSVGLTNVLIQQITLREALQSAAPNLSVLSSGPTPPNPSEVLASSYVRDVIRSLLDMVDYVVIDTAPLLPVADGSEVAALAEGTLLVAREKLTTDTQVKRSVLSLTRVNASLMGVVLNGVPGKRAGDYDYGYGYYRAAPGKGGAVPPKPSGVINGADADPTAARHARDASEEAGSVRPLPANNEETR